MWDADLKSFVAPSELLGFPVLGSDDTLERPSRLSPWLFDSCKVRTKKSSVEDDSESAMLSRGFNGDVKIMQDFQMRTGDYVAGISALLLSLLLLLLSQNMIAI